MKKKSKSTERIFSLDLETTGLVTTSVERIELRKSNQEVLDRYFTGHRTDFKFTISKSRSETIFNNNCAWKHTRKVVIIPTFSVDIIDEWKRKRHTLKMNYKVVRDIKQDDMIYLRLIKTL